jgi:dihydroxy-acid dehydratase
MVGMRFNTIGVSDGISMGTAGMSYSLPSRDLIADSIETVMGAMWYDGIITIAGCDKNMPGCLMAMARLDRPGLMVFGGTIRSGCHDGERLDIASVFQSYGEFLAGTRSEASMRGVVRHACPGAGACGGMYTANTMASAAEAMGMALPYSASIPATDPRKRAECVQAGHAMRLLLERNITPRQVITRRSLENALVVTMALGGSTNAVLHLIAIAHAAGLTLTLDDIQAVSDRVPFLADLKPSGRFLMEDLDRVGGTPAVMQYLLGEGLLHGDCLTVTGRTLAENLADLPGLAEGQEVLRPLARPIKATGHLQVLRGNLAPEGAVAKITGKEGERFTAWRSSPTGASRGPRTASWWDTSPPRRSWGGRWRWWRMATPSPSTRWRARCTWTCRTRSWRAAARPGPRRRRRPRRGCCASTSGWWRRPPRGA